MELKSITYANLKFLLITALFRNKYGIWKINFLMIHHLFILQTYPEIQPEMSKHRLISCIFHAHTSPLKLSLHG
jgi:hypothetical protein